MRSRNILLEAYDFLKIPENWNSTGTFIRGKECIVTGVFSVCVRHSSVWNVPQQPPLRKIRQELANRGLGTDIISWNDDPKTTHEDVLSVLRGAIRRASWPWEGVPA